MLMTVLAFVVVLGVLIFVHELGHFLAAKWAGIWVHRFSIGLGRPIPGLRFRRGETEYAIAWLPLGGYVRMATAEEEATSTALEGGAVEAPVPPDRLFESKTLFQRMVVMLGGVTMNVLFAWLVFTGLALKNGRQVDPTVTVGAVVDSLVPAGAEALRRLQPGARIVAVNGRPVAGWDEITERIASGAGDSVVVEAEPGGRLVLQVHRDALAERFAAAQAIQPWRPPAVEAVVPGRPAAAAGLEPGDTIVAIDGAPVAQFRDLVAAVDASGGRALVVRARGRAGERDLTVVPYRDSVPTATGGRREAWRIGITGVTPWRSEPYGVVGAVVAGGQATLGAATQVVRTVRGLFSGRVSRTEVGGPILIGQLAGQTVRLGLDAFLGFMALISVNLAVFNLLPVPVLDGGHLVFLLAEAVLRRPLPLVLRERLTAAGLVAVLLLMVLAFSNDLRRVFGG